MGYKERVIMQDFIICAGALRLFVIFSAFP